MQRTLRTIGVLTIAMAGLTSCGIGSLPHDERYGKIDKVLSDIDYQNIGTIVREEIDNGDGIFIPSYKEIRYQEDMVFDKILSKLQQAPDNVNEDCSEKKPFNSNEENKEQLSISCLYYGTRITMGKGKNGTGIKIIDSTNGR